MIRSSWLVVVLVLAGCNLAQLPEAVFRCEVDGRCAQPGYVCGGDRVCRPPRDAGAADDAGVDAGEEDAGFDAGEIDAGPEDGGFDAGPEDAGFDAGPEDAGVDAGPEDAGFDAGCMPTAGIDEPDLTGLDTDCDGFDGDLTRAVFVDQSSGLDTNAGTQAAPVQTLSYAATLGKEQIILSTDPQTGDVTLAEAVGVYGGYTAGGAWARTSTKSLLNGRLIANPSDAGRVVLERLEVQAPAETVPGTASVAVTLRNVANTSRITSCRFAGGAGANGADGMAAASVNNGNTGGAGFTGALGGDGGVGASGASCGDAGTSPAGFAGGGSLGTGVGLAGLDATQGGSGSAATIVDGGAFDGIDGGAAVAGLAGASSNTRPADPPAGSLGSIVSAQWEGVSLGTWTPAQSGLPGGGGGAGGGLIDLGSVLLARGGGAGGGGSGGCGARSGTAGQTGGASIALVLVDSSPTLNDVQLISTMAGRGGNGGTAGSPGTGGPGGAGSVGQTIATGVAGSGHRGAAGGAGGAGRQGPGGWGGPVVGLFCGGTSAPVTDASTTWSAGTPGLAGNGDPNGQAGGQPSSGYGANCP
ncbi:MAG: hypothetical protein Q8N23_11385 [Archangium sp.]|nr:hypothetical protein [Archangium sp.]MDP3569643.1 hypothetical protein [Archangium sp.]